MRQYSDLVSELHLTVMSGWHAESLDSPFNFGLPLTSQRERISFSSRMPMCDRNCSCRTDRLRLTVTSGICSKAAVQHGDFRVQAAVHIPRLPSDLTKTYYQYPGR